MRAVNCTIGGRGGGDSCYSRLGHSRETQDPW